ncbi:polysaccharide pyruvyl transferase [Niabella ginsenosidivorans]|uniref:Polysaccharide pyruvyl transferase n=1 Tax=Niabella ginsenosidivorans TaxID=1176587 RepID=A0A1A9I4P8_9BACT|nr:polysaccharide pyruvyl transferase family protein [Niabella ginsenosidivorans]ANH81680.1 polysaccharide pyruvyl transferase [Niabella ginsenosidivorans]
MYRRRTFIKNIGIGGLAMLLPFEALSQKKNSIIILRSSWQTVNIGDVGHTPGVIALLEKYLPDAQVLLWPTDVGKGVEQMLIRRFPKLIILKTEADQDDAIDRADFFLHGSGPSLTGRKELTKWTSRTNKPYGIYGITYPGNYAFPADRDKYDPADIPLMSKARFCYFRDSVSLTYAKSKGVNCPEMGFCPDGAFAIDLRDDTSAQSFLNAHNLQPGKFVCVIPQYRFSPWWEIPEKKLKVDSIKANYNLKYKEHDNAPIREAMIAVARQTDIKLLIVPENETQVRIGKEMLYDPLPGDVKAKTVWRDHYWMTDEAVSTYAMSAGLFGLEMHSPIFCIDVGVPAIVCHFDEQTSKGYMWKDIGLGQWLFDMDKPKDVARITPAVLDMIKNPKAAHAKVVAAQRFVKKRQEETMCVLKQNII